MLAAPADLTDDVVADALARGWALAAARMAYRPVGWGSHHWVVTDDAGTTWFTTVDDLDSRRARHESDVEAAYDRLRASLASAVALREAGRAFVVAPVPTLDDQPLIRADHYGVSLYPFVDGRSFSWGQWDGPAHREAVLEMLIEVHNAPIAARRHARLDTFSIPHRDELEANEPGPVRGPYSQPMAALLDADRGAIEQALDRYDELVARTPTSRMVLTHGEPHPGNTMRTAQGWRLIDWDTVLVAPPERDLWGLEPVHAAYARATGVELLPEVLELYRLRWNLADVAVGVNRFRRPHTTGPDEDQSWNLLQDNVATLRPDAA